MTQRTLFRVGAVGAMVGAVLGVIFNLLHPRGSGIDTAQEELELVAESGIWIFDHFMIEWSLVFGLFGLIAIASSFTGESGAAWGRFAFAAAIGSGAIAFVTVAVDGMAMKEVADNWAEAGRGTESAAFATGEAVAQMSLALFTVLIGTLFGLTPMLYGVASLVSREYPRWLGYVALVAGAVGILTASIQFLAGPSDAVTYLFTASSLMFTVWLFIAGWHLWRRADVRTEAAPRAAVAP